MNNLTTERTPLVIAAEINMITHQTKRILLASAIEIGRRLKEAKRLVKHGEWGKWLEESVSYSQSTADKLMKLFEEYGAGFPDEPGMSNSSPIPNLTYTQALLLLVLPADEREEFLARNDVAGMTNLELQQILKDRDQAKQAQEQALQENQVLKQGLALIDSTLDQLKKDQTKAWAQPHPETVSEEAPAAGAAPSLSNTPTAGTTALPTHNLQTEPDPNAAAKCVERCDTCRKTIGTAFFDLTTALTNLSHLDAKLKEEKRKEAQKLLETIAETIKEWPPAKKPLKIIH